MYSNRKHNLTEGLRYGDLENYVSELFTIDQYKSKMGEDKDILVLGFRVKEKYPAMDLVEFIEKGYNFILDADMSAGEEYDGQYQVFVEIERTPNIAQQLKELLGGVGQLTKCYEWRFRYQKAKSSLEFSEENILEHVPTTPEEYENKILEIKTTDVQDFFDQGSAQVALESDNTITFSRPYAEDIKAKFLAIGDYEAVKNTLPGAIDLSEGSQSQILFLNKFLGNYDIDKIGNKFLIRKGNQAVIIQKDRW